MQEKIKIEVNLSIDKSGGKEKLPEVIRKIKEAIEAKYPHADIAVRKGYFRTIDGIWASDQTLMQDILAIVDSVRKQVL